MLFDTDILIWVQRGSLKAANLIERADERHISLQTYLELLQHAKNKTQHKYSKEFLAAFGFVILPLTENIGHRAAIYIEEYALSSGLRAGDALIAATATENSLTLATGNAKHFRAIKDLSLKTFTP
ncbi:MAG: type II toxin-antitoxin system VapC family toxin [Thermodesulfobacteriota bacterium]|jgi:predicted nucleic acid-binding protein